MDNRQDQFELYCDRIREDYDNLTDDEIEAMALAQIETEIQEYKNERGNNLFFRYI